MFEIIAHRGCWTKANEKNSMQAFDRTIEAGFGLETDFRDRSERLAIAHDVAEPQPIDAEFFFHRWTKNREATLAINIKADGLQQLIKEQLTRFQIEKYFVFDASIPDLLHYNKAGLRCYVRMSDIEPATQLLQMAAGVWLDQFQSCWFDALFLEKLLTQTENICIVSPELHGRSHLAFWREIKPVVSKVRNSARLGIQLCTDFSFEAREFFNEGSSDHSVSNNFT